MADKLSLGDLNKMQESVKEMTDLSKKLRDVFKDINRQTDLTSNGFKNIVTAAQNNTNLSERYLTSQRLAEVLTAKINELKSKSGYLDKLSLDFKEQELLLQRDIMAAQLQAIQSSNNISAQAKQQAIDKLRTEEAMREAEFQVLKAKNSSVSSNNTIITQLQQQLAIVEGFAPELTRSLGLFSDFSNLIKSSFKGKIAQDFGKLGEYITGGITPSKLLFDIFEKGYENFKAFDKAATAVRSNLGVLPGQAKNLESLIKSTTIELMHMGVTFEEMGKSVTAISDQFLSLVAEDKDLLKTTTAVAKQFGVAESVSAKFLKTLGGISGQSASSQRSMIGFAQKMAYASGIPLGKLMNDVAEASDDVRIYVGSSAASMVKAAAATRMMGTDLNKAASTAEKLLQFESSIASELKASALLGQHINFNYARQLFFNKRLEDGNKEILRITKQVNFNQLNPIQQKAYADAAGKTVSELQDMLQQEKNMALVANSTDKNVRKRYEEYQKLMQIKAEDAQNEGKLAEQEFLRKLNQEKLTQLQNRFNQLMSELAEPVMEVSEFLLDIATEIMPYVIDGIRMGILLFGSLKVAVSKITPYIRDLVAFGVRLIGPLIGSRKIILSIGKSVLSVLGFFGKWLNPIGLIITAFQSIAGIFTQWKKLMSDFEGPIWKKILVGIYSVFSGIVKGLLGPFDFVIDKLDKTWFGKSPSMVGKNILKGIASIGPELHDSLVDPMNNAYSEIEKMSPPEISVENTTTNKLAEKSDNALISAIKTSNQQLIAKMDQLMTMMANGGIAVSLDGQLVSKQLATTAYRSGGFGQSTMRS